MDSPGPAKTPTSGIWAASIFVSAIAESPSRLGLSTPKELAAGATVTLTHPWGLPGSDG